MKLFILSIIFICVFIVIVIYACNKTIINNARNKVYDDVTDIPYNKVGLLLGTSKFTSFGPVNRYYKYRINAATELLKNNKIKYIIVSGDNSKNNYNEPEQMRMDLIKEGIDSSIIFLDYAGFRTFDSMIRCKKIFGQDKVTIISQQFHNERAIYIGNKIGLQSIGFNAKNIEGKAGYETQLREKLARVKVFVDFLTGVKAKFLGKEIIIPG